jgi:uncharacterized protein DUF6968
MKLENMGDIIATRKLTLVRDGQPATTVEVLMGKPQPTPDQTDFFCPYQISGGGREKVMAMHGIDAFQAMQLTLNIIGVELALINRDSGGKLFWEGDKGGNLDFPVPDWHKD